MTYERRLKRSTPDNIQKLEQNQIFVFGSNLGGFHGGGAAWLAHNKFGAKMKEGVGMTGTCYAIPTKDVRIKTMLLRDIKPYVEDFIKFAKRQPSFTFLVTQVGCGLAGYKPEHIAPLFEDAIEVENIHLPKEFWDLLLK